MKKLLVGVAVLSLLVTNVATSFAMMSEPAGPPLPDGLDGAEDVSIEGDGGSGGSFGEISIGGSNNEDGDLGEISIGGSSDQSGELGEISVEGDGSFSGDFADISIGGSNNEDGDLANIFTEEDGTFAYNFGDGIATEDPVEEEPLPLAFEEGLIVDDYEMAFVITDPALLDDETLFLLDTLSEPTEIPYADDGSVEIVTSVDGTGEQEEGDGEVDDGTVTGSDPAPEETDLAIFDTGAAVIFGNILEEIDLALFGGGVFDDTFKVFPKAKKIDMIVLPVPFDTRNIHGLFAITKMDKGPSVMGIAMSSKMNPGKKMDEISSGGGTELGPAVAIAMEEGMADDGELHASSEEVVIWVDDTENEICIPTY